MKKSPVAITVLLPVYNAEKYIAETVESILKQTFSDFEFIIIDDGSTDRSLEILQGYAANDQRVLLISRENKGVVETVCEGFLLSRGQYIARIDADDIALPGRLEIEYEFLQSHPDVVCVGSDFELIDYKGRQIGLVELPKGSDRIEQLLLAGECPIANPSTMVVKSAVDSVGGFNLGVFPAEDYALWVALLEIGEIENLSTVLLKYRIHKESVTQTSNLAMIQKTKEVCEAACQARGIACSFDENTWLETKQTRFNKVLGYGWYGFKAGKRLMAIEYSLKAISKSPFSEGGWRLLVCSLIKSLSN